MINGQFKTLKDVKQLENSGRRKQNFQASCHALKRDFILI